MAKSCIILFRSILQTNLIANKKIFNKIWIKNMWLEKSRGEEIKFCISRRDHFIIGIIIWNYLSILFYTNPCQDQMYINWENKKKSRAGGVVWFDRSRDISEKNSCIFIHLALKTRFLAKIWLRIWNFENSKRKLPQ